MIQRRKDEDYSALSFPAKLHSMLDDAARLGFDDIVSWQPEGSSFKVMHPDRFAEEIMQSYFNQTKYKSFQRQINMYGFRRIHLGPNMGGYVHHNFNRQTPGLSDLILRRPSNQVVVSSLVKKHAQRLEFIHTEHKIKVEDSEVTASYDFFHSQEDATEKAWFSSIFEGDIVSEPENYFLNDIAAVTRSFDSIFQEGDGMDDQTFSLLSEEYQQTQPPPAVSDHEVEDDDELKVEPENHFLNHIAAVTGSFYSIFQEGDVMDDQSFSLFSEECQQKQPAAVSDYEVEDNDGLKVEHIFPWKLHQMLERCHIENLQHIVSWVKYGSAFQVHDTGLFVEKVMPNYFDQTKYESFRRQLNLYGFTRVSKGPDRGVISHPEFVEGARSRCRSIVRKVS